MGSHPISRDESELGSVLEEDITRRLLGVDPDTVIGDDGACCWGNLELLGRELEDGCEGGGVRDGQHLEGELGVRGQGDLEGHLGGGRCHPELTWSVSCKNEGNHNY